MIYYELQIRIRLSTVHIYDLYHMHIISLSSYNGYKLNSLLTCFQQGFIAQLVQHRYRRGHGSESHWSLRYFFLGFLCNCWSWFITAKITFTSILQNIIKQSLICHVTRWCLPVYPDPYLFLFKYWAVLLQRKLFQNACQTIWKNANISYQVSTCNKYLFRAVPITPVTAELTGCYGWCKSPLYIVLSAFLQIVTGVHTQVTAD